MRRLSAFTLLEVLLSLLLLGVLGTFAILALQNLRGGVSGMSALLSSNDEVLWFSSAMRADIEGAQFVLAPAENSLSCVSANGTTRYILRPDHISRLTPDGQEFRFELQVDHSSAHFIREGSSLVALWVLVLAADQGGKRIAFRKTYAATELVRERTDAYDAYTYP